MSGFAAAVRIIYESFAYRVRMREANNLAVTVSMMLAFSLPWADLIFRAAYAFVLNVYVYLINDYFDIQVDLAAADKDRAKTRYMAQHRGASLGALLGLGAVLLGGALLHGALLHSWLLTLAFAANTLLITVYSAWLKKVPFMDLVMMALAGATMTMVGLPARPLGWLLLGLLGLLCAAYEAIQVIRDEPADREHGVRTTAVLLGARATTWVYRALMLAAALYGWLVVGSAAPLGLLLALLLPLTPQRAARTWDMVRIIGGLVWLLLLVQVFLGDL